MEGDYFASMDKALTCGVVDSTTDSLPVIHSGKIKVEQLKVESVPQLR